jgi:hypothetical protein
MDIFNLVKVLTTIITSLIAMIIGFRILLLNRTDWFNRWFSLFFISSSLGFLFYTIYHLILNNAQIIIPIMIITHIIFNFNVISLTMTVFILEKFSKVAMSFKYLGTMMILFLIMSLGYFIWIPELDLESYSLGIVNTRTTFGLFIFVNVIRVILCFYVVFRYTIITKNIEAQIKKRMRCSTNGVIIMIIGIVTNISAALFQFPIEILIEIVALLIITIGSFIILYGFLI